MPRTPITREQLAYARYQYEQTRVTNAVIADGLGIDKRTLLRRISRWGWVPRRPPIPEVSPPAAIAPDSRRVAEATPATTAPLSRTAVTLRVQERVERELAVIDAIVDGLKSEPREPADLERAARTLASLSRTLRDLKQLDAAKPKSEPADDAVPRSVDELRRSLAEKLERLVAGQQGAVADGS